MGRFTYTTCLFLLIACFFLRPSRGVFVPIVAVVVDDDNDLFLCIRSGEAVLVFVSIADVSTAVQTGVETTALLSDIGLPSFFFFAFFFVGLERVFRNDSLGLLPSFVRVLCNDFSCAIFLTQLLIHLLADSC